jgi:hypothetical protein
VKHGPYTGVSRYGTYHCIIPLQNDPFHCVLHTERSLNTLFWLKKRRFGLRHNGRSARLPHRISSTRNSVPHSTSAASLRDERRIEYDGFTISNPAACSLEADTSYSTRSREKMLTRVLTTRFALGASGLAYGGLGVVVLASSPITIMIFDEGPKSTKKPANWFLALGYIGFGPTCLVSCWDLMDASKMPRLQVPMAIYTPLVYAAVYVGIGFLMDEDTWKKLRKAGW